MLRDDGELVSRLVRGFTADVRRTAGLDVAITVAARPDGIAFTLTHAGAMAGECVGHPEADTLDWLAWLFDEIQYEWVIEQVHGAWPRCPRHEHPLEVRRTGGGLAWHCPAEPSVTAPVGAVTDLTPPA